MRITQLPYQPDSLLLFQHFHHLKGAVFLDSCAHRRNEGRFDIISAEPIASITPNTVNNNDPFDTIQTSLQSLRIKHATTHSDLPFTIGVIGYLSYETAWRLEELPYISMRDISLPEFQLGIYDWSIVVDHVKNEIHIIATNDNQINKIKHYLNTPPINQTQFSLIKPFQCDTDKSGYIDAFHILKKHIKEGNCYEACLCHRFSAEYEGSHFQAYSILRDANPSPFSAYLNLENGAILSVSPERFLQVRNKQVETKPIKGTSPRFSDPEQDQQSAQSLLNSTKDKAENVMIVDLMRNDLSRCCKPGTVRVPSLLALESFPHVHHLVSTVTGELLDDHDAIDLLRACFPGGSITGAPKISAMKIIESVEKHHRSVYTGSIGYIDVNGDMDMNIVIRTMLCEDQHMYCYAGGAIVHDSVYEDEYQETLDKVQKLIRALEKYSEVSV